MTKYIDIAEATSKLITNSYSSSFGLASKLFDKNIKADIYNIYGLVRLADEIVDSYGQTDAKLLLDDLEAETYAAIKRRYSTNLVIESFQKTANNYDIEKSLIAPFFKSMNMDLNPKPFTKTHYQQYIFGSAEVVGLMCLKVFTLGDNKRYKLLVPGAVSLGAAYQKINFLRDMGEDYRQLGRYYFPYDSYKSFSETTKSRIINDIRDDFNEAEKAIILLPGNSRSAVALSYAYFKILLDKLERTPVDALKQQRVSISNFRKLLIMATGPLAFRPEHYEH